MFFILILLGGALVLLVSACTAGTVQTLVHPVALYTTLILTIAVVIAAFGNVKDRTAGPIGFALDATSCAVLLVSATGASVGLLIIVISTALNLTAMLANGFRMPAPVSYGPLHVEHDPDNTRCWALTDVFPMRWPNREPGFFSAGDAGIAIGLWVFTAELWFARV